MESDAASSWKPESLVFGRSDGVVESGRGVVVVVVVNDEVVARKEERETSDDSVVVVEIVDLLVEVTLLEPHDKNGFSFGRYCMEG